jgi:DNA-binding transcriptional regulator YiaG
MPEEAVKSGDRMKGRAFPWHCGTCRAKDVWPAIIAYQAKIRHDGTLHTVDIPNLEIPKCRHCGEVVFSNDTNHHIYMAFRAQVGLLTPEEIRAKRQALGLAAGQLAEAVRVPEALVVDWEDGLRIQTRAQDLLLRTFFAVPEARTFLGSLSHLPSIPPPVAPTSPAAPLQHAS